MSQTNVENQIQETQWLTVPDAAEKSGIYSQKLRVLAKKGLIEAILEDGPDRERNYYLIKYPINYIRKEK